VIDTVTSSQTRVHFVGLWDTFYYMGSFDLADSGINGNTVMQVRSSNSSLHIQDRGPPQIFGGRAGEELYFYVFMAGFYANKNISVFASMDYNTPRGEVGNNGRAFFVIDFEYPDSFNHLDYTFGCESESTKCFCGVSIGDRASFVVGKVSFTNSRPITMYAQ